MLLIASQSCPGLETDWQHTSSSLSDADTTNSLASHSFAFRRAIHFIIWTCCWHNWNLIWEEGAAAVYRLSEPGYGPPWSWKRKKILWRKLTLWLRTFLTMWSWRRGTTRSISCLYFFRFKVSSKLSPGSRLLIVNSLSKHLAHPFLLPAAHKIVNCLGKQAMGNLGVERHKSQRENYGTLLYYVHGQMGST